MNNIKNKSESCSLEQFDLFGVNFELRMQDYQKFKSKTGAFGFLTYFSFCTICALALLTRFINMPQYSIEKFEEPLNSQQIKWTNENFQLAIKLPTFYDDNDNVIDYKEMFYVKAIQRSRNSSRVLDKTGKETKIQVDTKLCNLTEIFSGKKEDLDNSLIADYKNMKIICFELNETHFIKNSEFTNHSYVRIQMYVNKTYLSNYFTLVRKHMENDPFYLNIIFPVNIISDDYTKSKQFLNGIFLYLNEREKTVTDIYLKKSIYRLDDNVIFNNPIDYHYNDYYSHNSYNIIDDFFYKFNISENGKTDPKQEELDYDAKIAKIYIRNHIMSSTNVKTRQKLLPFLLTVNSIYINVFLTIKMLFMYINLGKAKIHILQNLFELNFSGIQNGKDLIENETYIKLKMDLNKHFENVKSCKNNRTVINDKFKDLKEEANILGIHKTTEKRNLNKIEDDEIIKTVVIEKSEISNYSEIKQSSETERQLQINNNLSNIDNINLSINNTNKPNNLDCLYRSKIFSQKEFLELETPNRQKISNSNSNSIYLELAKSQLNKSSERTNINKSYIADNIFNLNNSKKKSNNHNDLVCSDLHINVIKQIKQEMQRKSLKYKKIINKNSINLKNMLGFLFKCQYSKFKNHLSYFLTAEKLFNDFFDIRNFILKMNEIELLKKILLDENQKFIFEFLKFPNIVKDDTKNILKNQDALSCMIKEEENVKKAIESIQYENHNNDTMSKILLDIYKSKIEL